MSERTRRIGANEALFRGVNEEIEALSREMAEFTSRPMQIVCECGDIECTERVTLAVDDYERIRADPALFFVRPGHELPEVETVVERNEEFFVVRKRPGEPEQVARATDRRS